MLIADERGQTLPELMIATVIGLIVIFAAFMALDTSVTVNNRVSQREDASQRGRLGMDLITREIRSQICVTASNPAIVQGNSNFITFTDDLTGNQSPPMERTITYVPPPTSNPSGPGKIVENMYQGVTFPPTTTFPSTPTRTVTILDQVVPQGGVPVFQYYRFAAPGTPGLDPTPLAVPLLSGTVDTRGLAVDVRVSFVVRGNGGNNPNSGLYGSAFQNDIYTRVADPTTPQLGTNCS